MNDMRIGAIGQMRRSARLLRNWLTPGGLILMYHCVDEARVDPWSLCVSLHNFAEHMEILQRYSSPTGLRQLVQADRNGNMSNRAVAVTFDDGYADNLHKAKPILEENNIPAIVFVTAGHIGRQREFWWDELGRVLLEPGRLPESLCLRINGCIYEWKLGAAADYSEDNHRLDRYRKAWEGEPGSRLFFYQSLWDLLQPLPNVDREKLLDEILTWAGVESICRPTHRTLIRGEVIALSRGGLIEVGAHTVTHPLLSALPSALQREEIQKGKARLEEILDGPVKTFAYPFGSRSDYTMETVSLVKEAGFACACGSFDGVVRRNTDRFQLPRVQVHDWDGEEFSRRLWAWFKG